MDVEISALIENRNRAIREAVSPLPGSVAYDNYRPINIPGRLDGRTLLESVCEMHPHVPVEQWQEWFQLGHLLRDNTPVAEQQPVQGGEQYWHLFPDTREPDVDAEVRIIWEDDAIVGLIKPAPLPCHPSGRFNLNTLTSILSKVYQPDPPHLVHRLDANTTGVMVLARSKQVATDLRNQFESNSIRKRYVARVRGRPLNPTFHCDSAISRERMGAGIRSVARDGMQSHTDFRVLQRLDDGTTLVEAIPRTGRTNQIRAHLSSLGMPIAGDPSFGAEGETKAKQTLTPDCEPMCLHAASLTFRHPKTGQPLQFVAPFPKWAGEADRAG